MTTPPTTAKKVEPKKVADAKPPKDTSKIQTHESSASKKGLIVSIDTVKKPENSNKLQELEAMEEALKKATEEAHK
jgi:hypothetical protein